MKIAYIIPSLAIKGPIIIVHTIIANLVDKVDKIDVYYFDEIKGLIFECDTHRINSKTAIPFDKYDIIHSHGYRPDKYVAKWRNNIKRAKIVSTIHSDIEKDLSYTYNPIISFVFSKLWFSNLKKMDAIAVISNNLLNIYEDKFKCISVIYNGITIDTDNFIQDSQIIHSIKKLKNKGLKIIGAYAAITKIKGFDMLIALLDERDDIGLVLIGEGKEKQNLQNIVEKNGYNDRVLFFPYLPKPYNYISDFDVYSMPSRSEGFGLAMVEAAYCKIPIVCSDIKVFREIFNDTQVAFFELENIKSLSDAITTAITKKDQFIQNAFTRVDNTFTGKIMANKYFNFYKKTKGL